MPRSSRISTKLLTSNILALCGVCSFALAQPFYALMANYVEFFVGYRATTLDMLLFVGGLSLLPPLLLGALEAAVGLTLGRRALGVVHTTLMSLLLYVAIVSFLNKVNALPAAAIFALALVLTGALAVLFVKQAKMRELLPWLAFAALLFPFNFLLFTPVRKIVLPEKQKQMSVMKGKNSPTFVIVMFDEFPTDSLMDSSLMIDRERFPNFASFLGDAVWYRRATTESSATVWALPSLLTGQHPKDRDKMPIYKDYPNNLFTLLAKDYRMNVCEHITQMCPPEINEYKGNDEPRSRRLRGMMLDSGLIYLHVILPKEFEDKLPSVSHTVKGFFSGEDVPEGGAAAENSTRMEYDRYRTERINNAYRNDRYDQVQSFIKSLEKGRPSVNFLHVELPHCFYDYLPSGQFYSPEKVMDGWLRRKNTWVDDPTLPDLAHQRHLLQVGFTDRMFGDIVARLKEIGLYDECFIILTADHGCSYRPNDCFRPITATNYTDIVGVPLFVKYPFKKETGIRDDYVHLSDVLPSLAEILGVKIPWKMDGTSLLGKNFPKREIMNFFDPDTRSWMKFKFQEACAFPNLKHKIALFGEHVPLDETFYHTEYAALVGKRASEVKCVEDAGVTAIVYNNDQYKNVDRASNYIPAYIQGKITAPGGESGRRDVAILVNGAIRAVTKTTMAIGNGGEFRAIIPYKHLVDGGNKIALALIEKDAAGNPALRMGPKSGNYHVMNAQYLMDHASFATVKWPRKPKWTYIKVSGDSLQMTPHNIGDPGHLTTLRMPLAPGAYQLNGMLQFPDQVKFPAGLRISVLDDAGNKTQVFGQHVRGGSRVPMSGKFVIAHEGCELSIECLMGEGARDNWGATLDLQDLKIVQFEETGGAAAGGEREAVAEIVSSSNESIQDPAWLKPPQQIKSEIPAAKLLEQASFSNTAWPGKPEWKFITADADLLWMTPRNKGENDVTTIKTPLEPGRYLLHSEVSLTSESQSKVVLIIAVVPQGAKPKAFQRLTIAPGNVKKIQWPLTIGAGDELLLQSLLAPEAENNWHTRLKMQGTRLQAIADEEMGMQ